MRQITTKSIQAFNNNEPFKLDNTAVIIEDNKTKLSLFGHVIAIKEDNRLFITNCGYETRTTKERLNGLPNVDIVQRKSIWYLNGKEWEGELIEIK